mgnify:CR=1 FL=1
MVHPLPNLVVEILSESTKARDRGIKYTSYESHGVEEYWIIDPLRKTIEQYISTKSKGGKYKFHLKGALQFEDVLNCPTIADLVLPVAAIFDAQENMKFVTELTK